MADYGKNRKPGEKMILSAFLTASGAPVEAPVIPGYYVVSNIFGTISFVITGQGVVVVDSGFSGEVGELLVKIIRKYTDEPIKYLIYTHGHADHVKGAPAYKREGAEIIAHTAVAERFKRYTTFSGYHARINGIQSGGQKEVGTQEFWSDWVYPDIEYDDTYEFTLGEKRFLLRHEKGETDDATVISVPQDGVVFSGDLITGAFPNIGNPNKVIRYEREWFEALDRIAAENPKYLIPGHGAPLSGDSAKEALRDGSKALRILYEKSVEYINQGRDLDYIIEHATLPDEIKNSPYIKEVYGSREFTLRGIHRRYTGWYDGNPSNLNPAVKTDLAKAVFELIGDRNKIIEKAKQAAENGDYRLALHILDLAIGGNPDDTEALLLKADNLAALGNTSKNLFYVNFYLHEAEKIKGGKKNG